MVTTSTEKTEMPNGVAVYIKNLLGLCIGGEVRCRRAECGEQAHFLFRSKMTAQSNIKCAKTQNINKK